MKNIFKFYLSIVFIFTLGFITVHNTSVSAYVSWEDSPSNWKNSESNWENSSANWKNSPSNWKNSEYNTNSSGVYDSDGNRTGYMVEKNNGDVNIYDKKGDRTGYIKNHPEKNNSLFGCSGFTC